LLLPAAHAQQDLERPPFVTSPPEVVERMLTFAGAGPSDLVADLGSGDGRIVIMAAQKYGARGLGIELDGGLVKKSREAALAAGVADRVEFVEGNVLTADFSRASVVTIYLLPGLMNQLQPRFLETLQPGTRIVAHAFFMTGWKADRTESWREPRGQYNVFLWVVPARARGEWRAGTLELHVTQNFQEIEVQVGKTAAKRATLEGKNISWETADARFEGTVEGASMRGELTRDGQKKLIVFERR
jgi:SAM-dependent methyltransferase